MNRFLHTIVRLSVAFFLVCQFCLATQAQLREYGNGTTSIAQAPHVIAELLPGAPAYAPGSKGDLALVLHLEQGWHVYSVQAGDSGEPPIVEWTLPKGVHLGPMEFPAPKRLPLGPLMDYGYEAPRSFPSPGKPIPISNLEKQYCMRTRVGLSAARSASPAKPFSAQL